MSTALDRGICRSCGAPLRLEDLFCANCGAAVPDVEPRPRRRRVDVTPAARPWGEPGSWGDPAPGPDAPPWGDQRGWGDRAATPTPTWWAEPPSGRAPARYDSPYPATPVPVSDGSRFWAAAAPLGIVAGAIFSAGLLSFVIPLLVWQLRKGTDEFAAASGRESLNAMLSLVVYGLVGVVAAIPVTLATFGIGLIVMAFVAGVIGLVFLVSVLVAIVRALNSQPFRYPLMIRFFRG